MSKTKSIIMYDDAPVERIMVECWKVPDGGVWKSEHVARYAACTHRLCGVCGEPTEKMYLRCRGCREIAERERHARRERRPYDGSPVVTAFDDRFFFSEDDLAEWLCECMQDGLERGDDPMLLFCVPDYGPQPDDSMFDGHLPDDYDGHLPSAVDEAIAALRETIKANGPYSWRPGKIAVDPATLPWPDAEGGEA